MQASAVEGWRGNRQLLVGHRRAGGAGEGDDLEASKARLGAPFPEVRAGIVKGIAVLRIRYLQFRSAFKWAVSNLVALLRWYLFSYRDLREWLNRPFDTPPAAAAQLQLNLDSTGASG
jgi:hypothetical protein